MGSIQQTDDVVVNSKGAQKGDWSPSSWREKPIKQPVIYENEEQVKKALHKLERCPPLVTPHEIWKLRKQLKECALGKSFLLQGGDCAELFDYCNSDAIDAKMKLLLQMSLVLIYGAHKPVVRIARIAGQFAKPRSSPTEMVDGQEIPSFRGDILNGFDTDDRALNPHRMVMAYFHSAATLNYLRSQLSSGFADLQNPMDWGLGHVKDATLQARYAQIVSSISESVRFMRTVGADTAGGLQTVDVYTSHEGLLLDYEECLTRKMKHPTNFEAQPGDGTEGYYNTGTHFIWVGDRTRQPDHAHIEYFRGIHNPIGIKVGPTTKVEDLTQLLDIVNPNKEIGKVTLITRYGEGKIAELLPQHIEAVRKSGHTVVWQCDPMHGNTRSTSAGIKTRSFASVFSELSSALYIHSQCGSFLGGVHLELTGDDVTECTGGSVGLQDHHLGERYETFCDPRLNEKQALELAFLVAGSQRDAAWLKSIS